MSSKLEDIRKNKIRQALHRKFCAYISVQNKTRTSLTALIKRLCNTAASTVVTFRNEKKYFEMRKLVTELQNPSTPELKSKHYLKYTNCR